MPEFKFNTTNPEKHELDLKKLMTFWDNLEKRNTEILLLVKNVK